MLELFRIHLGGKAFAGFNLRKTSQLLSPNIWDYFIRPHDPKRVFFSHINNFLFEYSYVALRNVIKSKNVINPHH